MARERGRERFLLLPLACLVLAASACGGSTQDTTPARETPPVSVEHVAAIGCVDCEGPEQLSVTAVTVGSDGTVALTNRFAPLVRLFDRDGRVVSSFGRYGEGPGELGAGDQTPPLAAFGRADGSLLVHTGVPPALHVFQRDGSFDGRSTIPMRIPLGVAYSARPERLYLLSFQPGGSHELTRFDLPSAEPVVVLDEFEGFPLRDPDLGSHIPLAATPGGGFALANPRTYRIHVYDNEGHLERVFGRDLDPPAKPAEALEKQRAEERETAARFGREATDIPPTQPYFDYRGFASDEAGRLWILRGPPDPGGATLDVFGPGGGFLAELELPVEIKRDGWTNRALGLGGDTLAVATVGPGGEDVVEVYRVSAPATPEATPGATPEAGT